MRSSPLTYRPTHTADPSVHSARCGFFADSSESARRIEHLVSRLHGTLPGIVAARTPHNTQHANNFYFFECDAVHISAPPPLLHWLPHREQGSCATSSCASSLIERTD